MTDQSPAGGPPDGEVTRLLHRLYRRALDLRRSALPRGHRDIEHPAAAPERLG